MVGIGSGGTPVHVSYISNGSAGAKLANPWGVFVSGDYAYVASYGSNALEIVDVSDPTNPVHASSISDGDGGAKLNGTRAVFVSGNYAYVTSAVSKALEIVDVSDPTNPVHVTSISDGDGGAKLSSPRAVVISGDYAYVTSGMSDDALNIVDVSDPAHPVFKANLSPVGNGPYSLAVSGDYAYIASCDSDEVHTVDVSDPTNPVLAGSISDGDGGAKLALPFDISVSGNHAYVASFYSDALEIVNISNPANPVHAGSISDGGDVELYGARGVFVSGNYAYVASQDGNALEIVDVSDPANPVHAGSIRNGDNGAKLARARNVYVKNNYAYVTSTNISYWAPPDGDALEIVFFYEGDPFPNITRVTPDSGVNSGTCVATITGSNFQSGVNVDLTRAGEPNITATGVSTLSFTNITCTFDLTGRAAGLWNVVVTNPDGQSGTLENGFTITSPAPTITITSPNGGEIWKQGTSHLIRWTYTGDPGANVKIQLLKAGVVKKVITASTPIGTDGAGSFKWKVPFNQALGKDYKVRVISTSDAAKRDVSDKVFSISAGAPITVRVPNGGEVWKQGTTQTIKWTYTGNPGPKVKIELLKGTTVDSVVTAATLIGKGGAGSYTWKIPLKQAAGTDYRIRITSTTQPTKKDVSNKVFRIKA